MNISFELSETSRVVIDGGTIVRNASDGYVIVNGQITKIGDIDGGLSEWMKTPFNITLSITEISPQSLMNQDAQKEILKILNNTADYLLQNGKKMSDADLESVIFLPSLTLFILPRLLNLSFLYSERSTEIWPRL